jgi:hypothetical protein
MKKLTIQDYIELETLIKNGVGEFEQNTFLLSRYFDLEIDHIKKIDIRLANLMMNEMKEYLNKKQISKKEINDEIYLIYKEINKDHKDGKHDGIDDRYEILDL